MLIDKRDSETKRCKEILLCNLKKKVNWGDFATELDCFPPLLHDIHWRCECVLLWTWQQTWSGGDVTVVFPKIAFSQYYKNAEKSHLTYS